MTLSGELSRTNHQVEQRPLFFNYHEYTETYYADIGDVIEYQGHDADHELCITHFPNIYVPLDSEKFRTTRIVRIPRSFESSLEYPQFSAFLPGSESAAVTYGADGLDFVQHGYFDDQNQIFGYSSVSPLSDYLTEEEFNRIIIDINTIIRESFQVSSAYNISDLILELLTLTMWKWISKYVYPHPLLKVEEYIERVNESRAFKEKNIKMISLRESGFLSLDFEIPKPVIH
ncbi:hypothetical protein TPHA_0P01220 [Tetrapisispora phaffii CBS 4417]|uniref:Ras modification protein ERF4 n=1 Tax=Tetrapisispora phaffii (strain ATCC 24235 / CBS 4417 / NBRC 1672 / NRRL Y-8282 / UCD 70-5) TaxID=1071381 RepID=G8C2A2_TETPH|nr:hypothetical protein TPHA_0P01220 [Tetrapisispora phaffii CBS 4417]CCE66280.1 hypothetical protein TPHA_0P01220 [Tetrapisispora phaffii CBS 4417]